MEALYQVFYFNEFNFLYIYSVSLSDEHGGGTENLWGDLLALLSALSYALYVTLFKKYVKNEERMDNTLFLGKKNLVY